MGHVILIILVLVLSIMSYLTICNEEKLQKELNYYKNVCKLQKDEINKLESETLEKLNRDSVIKALNRRLEMQMRANTALMKHINEANNENEK